MVVSIIDHADYLQIQETLSRHAHLFDNKAWEKHSAVYLDEISLFATNADTSRSIRSWGEIFDPDRIYYPHHTTDVVVSPIDRDTVRAWSKFFVVRPDGTIGSGDYFDTLTRTEAGWRVASRKVSRGRRETDDPDGPSSREHNASDWVFPS